MRKNLVTIGRVVPKRWSQTDKHTQTETHTQTDTLITILRSPIGGGMTSAGVHRKHIAYPAVVGRIYRPNAARRTAARRTADKCGQWHVVSVRRRLNTDLVCVLFWLAFCAAVFHSWQILCTALARVWWATIQIYLLTSLLTYLLTYLLTTTTTTTAAAAAAAATMGVNT